MDFFFREIAFKTKDNKGRLICIREDFTLCYLDLRKEEETRTWLKLDHKNGGAYTHIQKGTFNPANDGDDKLMFFWRVRSKMIAKRIEISLTSALCKVMLGKRKHFTWMGGNDVVSYNGPTMLQLIVSTVNPSTCVGIYNLKTSIRTALLV